MTNEAGLLVDTVAIVTGGAAGQGAAEAQRIVAEGGRVVIGDVAAEEGEALAVELGDAATFVELDVTDEALWRSAVDVGVTTFGKVTALVNNAGITTPPQSIIKTSPDEYRRVIEVNQIAAWTGIHVVAPAIVDAGGGAIVNVSSVNGFVGAWGIAGYVSAKFALRGLTKVAAIELIKKGIRVNSVHPGPIDTEMIRTGLPGTFDPVEMLAQTVPIGRVGSPDEVANLVVWLLSDEAGYCVGAEFIVDGGYLAGPMGYPT